MGTQPRRLRRVGVLMAVLMVSAAVVVGAAQGADKQGAPLSPEIMAIMDKPAYRNAAWGLLELDPATDQVVHTTRAKEMWLSRHECGSSWGSFVG
ncbi:MAG: hypothetical protein ACRDTD_27090 [Pseudonocardiaceae bacterium]